MPLSFRRLSLFATTALLAAAAGAAHAAPDESARARYERDRQACLSGNTQQSQAVCLQEAGAALESSRAGQLTDAGAPTQQNNAVERCDVFKTPDDRAACLDRVKGQGAVSGSPAAGGVLRESTTTTITPAPASR
ncbi:hypothetical protein [Paracidovorax valerianellae]|uniref:Cysteine rich repeat-containing protein n=1 Tax=Paracidovorax valerianellae TaxID=187868 RepID=A0A1G7AZ60_9BURK|nr:hypothetical protein [Paracidovorax valerianellae]MDA8445652.1 hypothetical protein [Paracidovorax valerianellae]SDE19992.1 hypothetical protein SAMN05192589_113109 [Paracidovorax valerianellae]